MNTRTTLFIRFVENLKTFHRSYAKNGREGGGGGEKRQTTEIIPLEYSGVRLLFRRNSRTPVPLDGDHFLNQRIGEKFRENAILDESEE